MTETKPKIGQPFEDFLVIWHADLFPQLLLDDDSSDHFNDWLQTLDGEAYIGLANLYGKQQMITGMNMIKDIAFN